MVKQRHFGFGCAFGTLLVCAVAIDGVSSGGVNPYTSNVVDLANERNPLRVLKSSSPSDALWMVNFCRST